MALGTLDGILSLYFDGNLDAAFAFGGEVAGRIDAIETVADIVRSTMSEFYDVIDELARQYPVPR